MATRPARPLPGGPDRTRAPDGGDRRSAPLEGIDTSTSNGKLTFHLFAALAEFERALVRERMWAGLDAARAWSVRDWPHLGCS